MLIDELKIHAKAGDGGSGVVRWRTAKNKPKMGPSGGDGGRGGDVYLKAVRDINTLYKYRNKKEFLAEKGENGMKNSMEGANGEDLLIELPIGSVVTRLSDNKKFELIKEGEEVLVLRGGKGGFGNEHFKSSRNVAPTEFTEGREGEDSEFFIELELIADVGFIGLPSAGKSSLLNELTQAQAKIGDYPFTTLEPNLGEFYGYVLADIPGLIEGASEGKGLGHKFLRHIKRTKLLVHCVSFENEDMIETYKTIRKELEKFNPELVDKKEIILLTKTDLVDKEVVEKSKKDFEKINPETQTVTVYDDTSIKNFADYLIKVLREEK